MWRVFLRSGGGLFGSVCLYRLVALLLDCNGTHGFHVRGVDAGLARVLTRFFVPSTFARGSGHEPLAAFFFFACRGEEAFAGISTLFASLSWVVIISISSRKDLPWPRIAKTASTNSAG